MKDKLLYILLAIFILMSSLALTVDDTVEVPFEIQVARGNVTGWGYINKFGDSPAIDTGDPPIDVWEGDGLYEISTQDDINQIASTDAADIGFINIRGLNAQYNQCDQTVRLNGTTVVNLNPPLVFVYRMFNESGATYQGDINLATSAAVFTDGVPDDHLRAKITAGNNQTLMAIYMVPANHYGYVLEGFASLEKTGNRGAVLSARVIPFGSTARLVRHVFAINGTGSSNYIKKYMIPDRLPPKSTILISVESVDANDTGVSAGFDILLEEIGVAQ